jgi:putative transposase
MAFIDAMRAEGHAVESTCRVLREQGCPVAARTYRAWKRGRPASARARTDATVVDALLATKNTPEGLYGRRKMTHYLRRLGHPVAFCTVDRLMTSLGMNGIRRGKQVRTTIPRKDAERAADLVTAPSPPAHRTGSGWPTSPIAGPGPGSSTSRSSSTCSPSGSWPGTRPPTSAPGWS